MLPAYHRWSARMLLNILQHIGQLPTGQNYPPQYVNSAELDTLKWSQPSTSELTRSYFQLSPGFRIGFAHHNDNSLLHKAIAPSDQKVIAIDTHRTQLYCLQASAIHFTLRYNSPSYLFPEQVSDLLPLFHFPPTQSSTPSTLVILLVFSLPPPSGM